MSERLFGQYFSKIVSVTAERSHTYVGCLLVKDNRIISQGYNGHLPGCTHESIVRNNHEQATVHAEQNAFVIVQRGVIVMVLPLVIHYPCIICLSLLASGITKIKYLEDYKNDELREYFCNQKR